MFYVSAINNNIITVTDSSDNVAENYTVQQLSIISKNVDIEGFDDENNIYVVSLLSTVCSYFNSGDFGKGLKYMGRYGLGLNFKSKPKSNNDGTYFVSNKCIRVYRNGIDSYSYYDENNRYKSGYTFADMIDIVGWYYSFGKMHFLQIL